MKAVAIVGIGCRFPKADDAAHYWSNILEGRTAFSDIPPDRWNHDVFYNASQRETDKAWTKKGSFIEDIRSFAALHYGIAPRRLEVMDPQQRLLIEATRVALQDAGYERRRFDRSRTGVYVGISVSEFRSIAESRLLAMMLAGGEFGAAAGTQELRDALMEMVEGIVPTRAFSLSGSLTALNAAAISQTFDFGGPSFTIDAACASASVGIHEAIVGLRAGIIDSAIAGGCYLNLTPVNLVAFTRVGAISPTGQCRPFDARADGFVQSDGVGLLFLKRLDDALRDGDRIHAVIRGTGCNSDGRGEGPMTPRVEGQRAVLSLAYADAGFSPDTVAYFEAHGTATPVGDPVEVEALGSFLVEAGVGAQRPAHIGSVKGNIGHAMSASGIAGLIKAVKLLEHRTAPPQAGYESPNPILELERWPLAVDKKAAPLEPRRGVPLRAAVSSFGFGGTNSHIVLEEAPRKEKRTQIAVPSEALPEAILVSAPSISLLADHARRIAEAIETTRAPLDRVAYTLNARRKLERIRAVVGARSTKELQDNLRVLAAALDHLGASAKLPQTISPHIGVYAGAEGDNVEAPKLAFLFPGQGAQRVGILSQLVRRFPRFEKTLLLLERSLEGVLYRPLTEYLYGKSADEDALRATEVCQPAMAALGIAVADLLESANIRPHVALGHSLGEFAALAHAGVLSPEAAMRFVGLRGRAMKNLSLEDPGAMAAVMADRDTVEEAIRGIDKIWIANVNHPRQVTISGTTRAMEAAKMALAKLGLEIRPLSVSHAFHTPLLEGIQGDVDRWLTEMPAAAPRHMVVSCVADWTYGQEEAKTKSILRAHATSTVDFVRALDRAKESGATVFVQAGAGTTLAGFARAQFGERAEVVTIAPMDDDGGYELIRAVAQLAALGVAVDFEALYAGEGRSVVELPETPLERQSYWVAKPKQPRPILDFPQPADKPAVLLGKTKGEEMASKPGEANPENEALVALFEKQAEVLRAHAEIIAQQNRALFGEAAPPAVLAAAPAPKDPPPAPAPATAAPPSAPKIDEKSVRDRVHEMVAKISAFPKESLRADQRLVDELGFDSLMVADLGGAIDSAYPSLGGLPPSLFSLSTTVGEVADHVTKTLARSEALPKTSSASAAAPAAEPIARYKVSARPRARALLSVHDPRGETWLVTEDGSDLGSQIGALLEAKGARVVRVRFSRDGVAAPVRLSAKHVNLWPEAFPEGLLDALAASEMKVDGFIHLAGLTIHDAGEFRNPILLFHPLASKLDAARLAVVTGLGGKMGLERSTHLTRNVLQSALLGYAKSLARERPASAVRSIDIHPETPVKTVAAFIVDEISSGDLTPEVGFDGQERYAPELVPQPPSSARKREIDKNDVVLLTGGAGDIGAKVALRMAAMKPKGIVLVGRREIDDGVRALLDKIMKLGTKAQYLCADVSSERALKAAAQGAIETLGQVTVAVHAAGAIEDAPAADKTVESIARVMNVKVLGLQALLRAFPMLRDVIVFSSWAGRFGNAHQADYAAANELVDRLAVASADPRVRMVSIVWPPWSSTKMVETIPAAIQKAMEREGVTFLSDAEGLAAFESIFVEGAAGMEVVGRGLPRHQTRLRHEERFTEARHPYLHDHRIKDRAVVPLACALDLVTFAAAGGKPAAMPFAVEGLELVRGLYEGDRAVVSLEKRVTAPGTGGGRVEIKVGDSVAYRAILAGASSEPAPAAPKLEGEEESLAALDLDAFYRHHTFHGPMLRGIVRVERMTKEGVTGVVRASSPKLWMPETERAKWSVDPLVIDGAFQLAGYWACAHQKRGGYPTGFDRFLVLRPFGEGAVRATLVLGAIEEETFSGSIAFEDEDGALCAVMSGFRGRFFEGEVGTREAGANGNGHAAVPVEHYAIASFPEVEALDQRFQMAELIGLRNPYFHVHAGTARNRSVVDGVEMINFSSYNYLGFSGHPEVVAAAKEAIDRYGTSVSASRVASGERPIHRQLEEGIARHVGVEDTIVFVSGHATNVTTIGHLFDSHDLIVHDSLIHDSIMQGVHLSGATRRPFPHGDVGALDRILAAVRGNYRRVLVCAEGIYSMDGDICDLPRLIEIKKRHRALLLIDEAHSIGVLGPSGRGVGHHFAGVDPNDVDIWMGTLSKTFASCGGYIAGSKALVRYLKYTAPGFVYSAGITPPNAGAALKALELMHRHPEIVERLRQRSKLFLDLARAKGIDTGLAVGAAVVPAIVGNSLDCMRLSEALAARRINVQPIVYPAVEDNASRLRFFLSATHTEEEIRHAVDVLSEELARIRSETQPMVDRSQSTVDSK